MVDLKLVIVILVRGGGLIYKVAALESFIFLLLALSFFLNYFIYLFILVIRSARVMTASHGFEERWASPIFSLAPKHRLNIQTWSSDCSNRKVIETNTDTFVIYLYSCSFKGVHFSAHWLLPRLQSVWCVINVQLYFDGTTC